MTAKPKNDNDALVAKISKEYEDKFGLSPLGYVPSGSFVMDYLFGGGFPIGKIVQLSSQPYLGKSLTALSMCKGVLDSNPGKIVLYLDSERGVTLLLLGTLGFLRESWRAYWEDLTSRSAKSGESPAIDIILNDYLKDEYLSRFFVFTPPTYEDVEELTAKFVETNRLILVVVDSITKLWPRDVWESEEKKKPIGVKAAYEPFFNARIHYQAGVAKFGLLYINQMRANIQMTGGGRGPALKIAGGLSSQHEPDVLFTMKMQLPITNDRKEKVGACVLVTQDKNRMVGNRSAYLYLKYGYGISNLGTLVSMAKWSGLCKQAGPYYSLEDPNTDFGEGVGKAVKVQGGARLDELAGTYFDAILGWHKQNGKLEEYFQTFQL
jgi:RecA/RadA recombinase